jgi:hypothetical protein
VACVLLGLLGWFLVELIYGGGQIGLAERILGAAQALWPLLVVLSCRQHRARARALTPGAASAEIRN